MAFKFNLDSVLKHRGRLEEMAQRDYHEAQNNVDIVLRRLESMYQRLDEVRDEIGQGAKHRAHRRNPRRRVFYRRPQSTH